MIVAVDPGPTESAYVLWNGERPVAFGKIDNESLLDLLVRASANAGPLGYATHMAIEMIASYGMPVGAEVFETCVWIGRYIEASGMDHTKVYRREVKLHLCGSARAKDGNVRQALIDKWGGKEKAMGRKVSPGPLYGVSADVWAALGVAVTYSEGGASQQAQSSDSENALSTQANASGEVR